MEIFISDLSKLSFVHGLEKRKTFFLRHGARIIGPRVFGDANVGHLGEVLFFVSHLLQTDR